MNYGYGCFKSYEMDIKYRVQVNFVEKVYYRKKLKQKSLSQYNNAIDIIVDDLHTIIDSIDLFWTLEEKIYYPTSKVVDITRIK